MTINSRTNWQIRQVSKAQLVRSLDVGHLISVDCYIALRYALYYDQNRLYASQTIRLIRQEIAAAGIPQDGDV